MIRSTTHKYSCKNDYNTVIEYEIIKKKNTKKNKQINLHLSLKTFVAGVRETERGGLLCRTTFTITNGITATYWFNGIFFFSCNFNKEPIPWHLLLSPFEDFAEMWHRIVVRFRRSHCYRLIRVVLFYKILHCSPHFTRLPNLIWSEGFLRPFLLLLRRWDADVDLL